MVPVRITVPRPVLMIDPAVPLMMPENVAVPLAAAVSVAVPVIESGPE